MADRVTGRREFYLTSAAVLLVLLVFFVLAPLPRLNLLQPPLDQSWQAALVNQFLRHAQDGTDVVFTYGPWGFLAEPRGDPAIYPWLVFGRLVLVFGVAAATSFLSLTRIRARLWRWIWLVWFLALVSPWIAASLLLYAVLFETDDAPEQRFFRRLCLVLLIPASALSAHIKLVSLPLVAALGVLILCDELFRARRLPWISGSLALCYAAFYFAAGQHAASFIPYLRGAFATMSGYSAGMAFEGPGQDALLGAAFCLIVMLAYALSIRNRRGIVPLAGAAWVAAYLFMAFKQAFVRQDGGHIWAGILTFAVPATLVLTLFSGRKWFRVLVPLAACATVYFAWSTAADGDLHHYVAAKWHAVRELPRAFRSAAERQKEWHEDLAAWHENYPAAALPGSMDILTIDILTLLANSADYRPRPVIQSYAAVNDYLADLNAHFLAGPRAPEYLLFDAGSIDNRYASTEDNLSWRPLLADYQPAGFDGSYLALHRSNDRVPITEQPYVNRTITWDSEISTGPASGGLIWAEIDLRVQPLGRFIDFLFRPPDVYLAVQAGGPRVIYRLIPPLARSGFLLSPIVEDPASFALLYRGDQGHPLAPDVTSLSLRTDSPGKQFYQPDIAVRLSHMSLPPRPVPEMLQDDKLRLAINMRSPEAVLDWDQRPQWSVVGGVLRLQSNTPSAGSLPYDGKAATLDVTFGLSDQCDDSEPSTARVEFRVSYRDNAGSIDRMLLRRTLDLHSPQTTAAEVLPLPQRKPGSLQFATTLLEGNCHLGAYWSRVKLH